MCHCFSSSGLAADKLDSFGPAFYMAGGALLVASVVPCALRCVKSATSSKENDRHIQEVQIHSNDTKPNEGDHILFISTVWKFENCSLCLFGMG